MLILGLKTVKEFLPLKKITSFIIFACFNLKTKIFFIPLGLLSTLRRFRENSAKRTFQKEIFEYIVLYLLRWTAKKDKDDFFVCSVQLSVHTITIKTKREFEDTQPASFPGFPLEGTRKERHLQRRVGLKRFCGRFR